MLLNCPSGFLLKLSTKWMSGFKTIYDRRWILWSRERLTRNRQLFDEIDTPLTKVSQTLASTVQNIPFNWRTTTWNSTRSRPPAGHAFHVQLFFEIFCLRLNPLNLRVSIFFSLLQVSLSSCFAVFYLVIFFVLTSTDTPARGLSTWLGLRTSSCLTRSRSSSSSSSSLSEPLPRHFQVVCTSPFPYMQ